MQISDKKGQTLVETALILLLLMLIIVGIMEFGRAMYFKNTANNAARGVVRVAVVTNPLTATTDEDFVADFTIDCNSPGTDPFVGTLTTTDFCNNFVPIASGEVAVDIDIYAPDGTAKDTAATGDTVYVAVSIPFESLTRLVTISPLLFGEASMRYE